MQGELNFYYGPMGCGKTRELLKVLHSKRRWILCSNIKTKNR